MTSRPERARAVAGRLVPLRTQARFAELRAAAAGRRDRPGRGAFDQPAAGPVRRRRGAAAVHEHARLERPSVLQEHRRPQVSAHFYIRRNGELWQFVSCDERAWHAGASHYRGPRRLQRRLDRHRTRRAGRRARSRRRSTKRWPALCAAIAQQLPDRAHRRTRAHRAGPQERSRRGLRLGAAAAQPRLGRAQLSFPDGDRARLRAPSRSQPVAQTLQCSGLQSGGTLDIVPASNTTLD